MRTRSDTPTDVIQELGSRPCGLPKQHSYPGCQRAHTCLFTASFLESPCTQSALLAFLQEMQSCVSATSRWRCADVEGQQRPDHPCCRKHSLLNVFWTPLGHAAGMLLERICSAGDAV